MPKQLTEAQELQQWRREINDRVFREVPEEKARSVIRQAEIARIMEKSGSLNMNGLGQKIGGVDRRTFFRWHQQYPGCWSDKSFVREFLRDNENARAPGYKPGSQGKFFDMGAKSFA